MIKFLRSYFKLYNKSEVKKVDKELKNVTAGTKIYET